MRDRSLCAITCAAYGGHQRGGRRRVRIESYCCIVQHQIDVCVLHSSLRGERPLEEGLARRAGHTRHRYCDALVRERPALSRFVDFGWAIHDDLFYFATRAENPM